MKEFDGKDVFLRPTGNNARRGSEQIVKAKIIKVARVNTTFLLDGWRNEVKLRYRGNELYSEHNSGYVVYGSEKDIEDYYLLCKLSVEVSDKLKYLINARNLGLEKVKKIYEILAE